MQSTDVPSWTAKKFAESATGSYVRAIPQTSADPGAASFDLGFPPQTFTDEGAGGTPPDGRDFNGILKYLTAWAQWVGLGGPVAYNAAVSAAGGYPLGAIVESATTPGLLWQSTAENNTTNPDGAGAGWRAMAVRAATLAEMQAATSTALVATPKILKDAGFDRIVAQNLADNNGYRVHESGFRQAWGFNNALGAGASQTILFSSFMPPGTPFTSFHRVVLGPSIAASGSNPPQVGITSTDVNGFTVRNSSASTASFQWQTEGV